MDIRKSIETYLDGLQNDDDSKILSVFEDDAVVNSPLYGAMPAKKFYTELSKATNKSVLTLIDVLAGENKNICAGYFRYEWTLSDGTIYPFLCVDVFEISNTEKFSSLNIVYDTAGVRKVFDAILAGK